MPGTFRIQSMRARHWLEDQLNGPTAVGLPWPSLIAFVRISINPRVFPRPLHIGDAWEQVQQWLGCDPVWTPSPTNAHAQVLGQLFKATAMTPNLIGDVHLAALALEHGLTLCSADGDFARFKALRWINPIAVT